MGGKTSRTRKRRSLKNRVVGGEKKEVFRVEDPLGVVWTGDSPN